MKKEPVFINGKPYVELLSYGEVHPIGYSSMVAKEHFKGRPFTFLEIGVLRGHNAEAIKKELNPYLMVLVDPWGFCSETHDSNWADTWFRIQEYKDIIVIKATSEQAHGILNMNFDYIYIDGDHTGGELDRTNPEGGIRMDIKLWLPRVNQGGILAGHDYNYDNIKMEVNSVFADRVCSSPYHPGGGMEWWVFI